MLLARPISSFRSLVWHMAFQPFKDIANWLAYFLSCLRLPHPFGRVRVSLWGFLKGLGRYRRYRSLVEEQKWWKESARTRAFFARTDARHGRDAHGCLSPVPLITSYVPRLLPAYRDYSRRRVDDAASERELNPSVYHKWHRLVYPHKVPVFLFLFSQAMTEDMDFCAESALAPKGCKDYPLPQYTRPPGDRAHRTSRQ